MKKFKFNFVKIQDFNDRWHTYSPISNQKLNKLLSKAKNAYVSKNKFIFYKEYPTYKFQNRLFLEYPLIDIDGQNFNSKEECFYYFQEILFFLRNNNIKIEEIVCTNTTIGGFQILLSPDCQQDFYEIMKNHPRFSAIDKRVFDTKRVRRLPSTYNGNRGSYSFEIPKHLNISEIRELLSFNNHSSMECGRGAVLENHPLGFQQPPYALGMPHLDKQKISLGRRGSEGSCLCNPSLKDVEEDRAKLASNDSFALKNAKKGVFRQEADDNMGSGMNFPPVQNMGRAREQELSALPTLFKLKQINNSINGVNSLYCPVMKFKTKPSRRLKRLQRQYLLGNLYLFQSHLNFFAISPKATQKRRLEKIYKKANSWSSLNEINKFLINWFPISNIFDINHQKVINTFKFLDFYPQEVNGWFSKPHLHWLQKYQKADYPEHKLIGNPTPKIYTAIFSTK